MPKPPPAGRPFRAAVLQGLALLFPPLLTVVIFLWIINTTQQYVLKPVSTGTREAIVWLTADIRYNLPVEALGRRTADPFRRARRQDRQMGIPHRR